MGSKQAPPTTAAIKRLDGWLETAGVLRPPNVVLTYHAVADPALYGSISVDRLRTDLESLTDRYTVVDLKTLWRAATNGESGRAAITFDDGYHNFYTSAVPILREVGVPATVFVCPGLLDDDNEALHSRLFQSPTARAEATVPHRDGPLFLTDEQLHELVADDLVRIGNHTRTHPDLATIDDEATLREEIVGARNTLERRFDITVDRFCYPYGRVTPASRQLAGAAHDIAVTTQPGTVLASTDPARLPRVTAHVPRGRLTRDLTASRWKIHYLTSAVRGRIGTVAGRLGHGGRS